MRGKCCSFGIILVLVWISLVIFIIEAFRFGKKSDVRTMKLLMGTDDNELAKNLLEVEEDKEQSDAIQKRKKHDD